MAIVEPPLSPVEELRRRVADSPRLQALDLPLLTALQELGEADFDDLAAVVGHDAKLRNGLGSWLVSAQARGLVTRLPNRGSRQWFTASDLGRQRPLPGE